MISLIAAVAQNGVIGTENSLPWSLPDDLAFFREQTKGHHIVMGRKTYASIGRLLPNRTTVILTRDPGFAVPGALTAHSVEAVLAIITADPDPFIVGGAEVYALFLPHVDRLILTEVHTEVAGDAKFPEFDKKVWRETKRVHHAADERHAYAFDFVTYEKTNSLMSA